MRAVLGEAHPSALSALYNLASAAEQAGDASGAAELVAHGLAVAEREHGPEAETTALFRSFAADLRRAGGGREEGGGEGGGAPS
ncbi:hypothetical protein [Nocardiopsis potens]|uniref:hypothetical protein n=1 Tax=Nocardiopsis potens TaxID=1246458 RepID=UPI00034A98BB|nr:hypothetical protein [Nocardiopsis potens]